jgi:hypothetical protein
VRAPNLVICDSLTCAMGAALLASCAPSALRNPAASFGDCRDGCRALESIEIPSCLRTRSVRDKLEPLLEELLAPLDDLELPSGACGCLTASLAKDGSLENPKLIYTNSADGSRVVVDALERLPAVGPLPAELECVVGVTSPITFGE